VKRPHPKGSPQRRYGVGRSADGRQVESELQAGARSRQAGRDLERCEGKADCVRVCPENVFEIRRIADVDYRQLGLLHRFKQRVHGMQVAYTPNEDACRSCALCVAACPEGAITLSRVVG
jgi:4Fe-4S ferredoxin